MREKVKQQKQNVSICIHDLILARRVFYSKCHGFNVARLTFSCGPCPVVHPLWRKVVPEVTSKGCFRLATHFIITLSYLLAFHMEQRQTTRSHTHKCTHNALLTLIIVSRSGTACVGGR